MNAPTGRMNVLDDTGHSEIKWNKSNPDEVATAREMFQAMKDKGHFMFEITGRDHIGRRADTFDPNVERYAMVPQLKGG